MVFLLPPPQYYTKQEPFDTVLTRLFSEMREELGDAVNDFSDDRIQAQYKDMFDDIMSQDDFNMILGTPFNKSYNDDEHALEACERLQPNE